MRKMLLVAGVALGFGGTGFAADLPRKAPPPPPPAPPAAFNWNGFYLGPNFGYGWAQTDVRVFDNTGASVVVSSPTREGIFGGGQIGYNWQFSPNWLFGIEADIEASDIKGSIAGCAAIGCAALTNKLEDFGTARVRLGYVINSVLLYGTGGFAWGDIKNTLTATCVTAGGGICPGGASPSPLTGASVSNSRTETGWSAGAGLEWGFYPNWTVKFEYMHLQFDNVGRGDITAPGVVTAFRQADANLNVDTVKVGVNYMFNWTPLSTYGRY
jgi:outer membrane immunogenic protein